jgi:hypothetical protein
MTLKADFHDTSVVLGTNKFIKLQMKEKTKIDKNQIS